MAHRKKPFKGFERGAKLFEDSLADTDQFNARQAFGQLFGSGRVRSAFHGPPGMPTNTSSASFDPKRFLRDFATQTRGRRYADEHRAKTPLTDLFTGGSKHLGPPKAGVVAAEQGGSLPPFRPLNRPPITTPVPGGVFQPLSRPPVSATGGTGGGGDIRDFLTELFGGATALEGFLGGTVGGVTAGGGSNGSDRNDEVVGLIEEQGRNRIRDLRADADRAGDQVRSNFASRGILSSGGARGAEIDLLSNLYRAIGGTQADIQQAVASALLGQERFDRQQDLTESQAGLGQLGQLLDLFGRFQDQGSQSPSAGGPALPPLPTARTAQGTGGGGAVSTSAALPPPVASNALPPPLGGPSREPLISGLNASEGAARKANAPGDQEMVVGVEASLRGEGTAAGGRAATAKRGANLVLDAAMQQIAAELDQRTEKVPPEFMTQEVLKGITTGMLERIAQSMFGPLQSMAVIETVKQMLKDKIAEANKIRREQFLNEQKRTTSVLGPPTGNTTGAFGHPVRDTN